MGWIVGALPGAKFLNILCFVLEIVCHGWRQPGESLDWETGTLLSSNWMLNNLTAQLAGPGRGYGVLVLLEDAKAAWPTRFARSLGTAFCAASFDHP